ncbi:hypothetical protein R0131_13595 [Clostridium sp. AL.422]|uniref:hypothetical protein n=1 Tax=Clostridium TaxID=1485 RepID=UPI00293DD8C9|nr:MULTISPECIES: hypothetical protein [unclassified Clostridium]MDV4151857.1 hypothetical protein [Clostridium sp. AL.422]
MKGINRKFERNMVLIGSIWQLLSGFTTIFIYATYIKTKGVGLDNLSQVDITSIQLLLDNVYILSTTIGFIFIFMGFINLFIYKSLRYTTVEKKKSIWLIISSIICYLLMDFISAIIFMVSGVIMLAKNKAIVQVNNELVNLKSN